MLKNSSGTKFEVHRVKLVVKNVRINFIWKSDRAFGCYSVLHFVLYSARQG